jgi:hypothetical protein
MKIWSLGYNKSKEKAKKIYRRIGIVQSPALGGDEISFNQLGFTHLVRRGRIPRSKNDQRKRFRLIPYLESIVTDQKAIITYDETEEDETINRHGVKMHRKSKGYFWNFKTKIEDCEVKITIRQLNNGKKHFFSVWGDNISVRGKKRTKKKTKKTR